MAYSRSAWWHAGNVGLGVNVGVQSLRYAPLGGEELYALSSLQRIAPRYSAKPSLPEGFEP